MDILKAIYQQPFNKLPIKPFKNQPDLPDLLDKKLLTIIDGHFYLKVAGIEKYKKNYLKRIEND